MVETKQFTDNIQLPLLGFGTWQMGGHLERNTSNDKAEIAAIKEAITAGLFHIDTAEMYGDGHAEELVAEAIKDVDRKSLFITSKVAPSNLHYDDVIAACERSLKRLNTTYLDLYLIHFPDPNTPIKETMEAMNFLIDQKLVKFIGVSNFTVNDLKGAMKHTTHPIMCNQVQYSLVARNKGKFRNNTESNVIPFCKENNIHIVAWRPLEYGKIGQPGKNATLDKITKKYNKTQAQVALNWLYGKDVFALVKATNPQHIKENIGSMGWRLEDEDVDALDDAFKEY